MKRKALLSTAFAISFIISFFLMLLMFSGCAHAVVQVDPPLIPDCRDLLASSYQHQMFLGDKAVSIRQISGGAALLDYINPKTGIYTEYFLVADDKILENSDLLGVYGSCLIHVSASEAHSATMYVVKWLTMPNVPNHEALDGKYGARFRKIDQKFHQCPQKA